MQILFLTHYFPPEVNAPATRTYEHCLRWVAAGHDVTVITCVPNCPDGVAFDGYQSHIRKQVETIDGIRVVRVWSYLAANHGTGKRIVNYLSFMVSATLAALWTRRPDVLVATSPQFFCGWAGVLVKWLKRVPLVLEVRDVWPESISAVGAIRSRHLLRLLESLERGMYRNATHIVTVGNGYRERILHKARGGDQVSVVTNGVDFERFQVVEDARFRHLWNLEDRFVCSYIGTIGMAHGLEVVVKAAQLLRDRGRDDIRFCLVGDGAERKRLIALCQEAGVEHLVVFPGRQPREEVPFILAASDACLIHLRGAALFESVIPSKIFETMAMGRPIVMGVRGEARELVMDAGAGIEMEPGSPSDLADAVERLADDPELSAQMGAAARGFVATRYDRNQLAEKYLRLLHEVVGLPYEPSQRGEDAAEPVPVAAASEERS